MFRKLYNTAAGAFDDAVGVIVDGLLAPAHHAELVKARADLQALQELQWQADETIERLSFDYKLAREELNKPVDALAESSNAELVALVRGILAAIEDEKSDLEEVYRVSDALPGDTWEECTERLREMLLKSTGGVA